MEVQKRPFCVSLFSCVGAATSCELGTWDNFIPVASIQASPIPRLTNFPFPLPRSDVCPQAGIYRSFFLAFFRHQLIRKGLFQEATPHQETRCVASNMSPNAMNVIILSPTPTQTSCVASTMLGTSKNVNITPHPAEHLA